MSMEILFTKKKICSSCKQSKLLKEFDTRFVKGKPYFRSDCIECRGKATKAFTNGAGREKAKQKEQRRTPKRYGLSQAEFEEKLLNQNFKCVICQTELNPASVDHDHITSEIRDLLCRRCNLLIGLANEDTQLLQSAIDYLRKWDDQ